MKVCGIPVFWAFQQWNNIIQRRIHYCCKKGNWIICSGSRHRFVVCVCVRKNFVPFLTDELKEQQNRNLSLKCENIEFLFNQLKGKVMSELFNFEKYSILFFCGAYVRFQKSLILSCWCTWINKKYIDPNVIVIELVM